MLQTLPRPTVFVRNPILVELCGAGFTKAPQSQVRRVRFVVAGADLEAI